MLGVTPVTAGGCSMSKTPPPLLPAWRTFGLVRFCASASTLGVLRPELNVLQETPPFTLFSTPVLVPRYTTELFLGSIATAWTAPLRTRLQLVPPSVLL